MHSPLPFIKAMAERMAINAPIQGTATADIIKLAIIDVDQALVKKGLKDDAHLIMQVHDELVFEVKKEKVEDFILIAQEKMCSVIPEEFLEGKVSVPLLVGIGRGRDYGALK